MAENELIPVINAGVQGPGAQLLLVANTFWVTVFAGNRAVSGESGNVFGLEVHNGADLFKDIGENGLAQGGVWEERGRVDG